MQNNSTKYLLSGGLVVDGTSARPEPGNVLISDGKIEAIGAISSVGVEEIDCAGKHHFDSFVAHGARSETVRAMLAMGLPSGSSMSSSTARRYSPRGRFALRRGVGRVLRSEGPGASKRP